MYNKDKNITKQLVHSTSILILLLHTVEIHGVYLRNAVFEKLISLALQAITIKRSWRLIYGWAVIKYFVTNFSSLGVSPSTPRVS
mgnify:CR=1 FL=1